MPTTTEPKTRTPRKTTNPTSHPSAGRAARAASHDEIAARAFELFCARGSNHGSHLEDWLRAEAELRDARTSTT